VVLAEVIWTLETAYKFDKGDVAATVRGLVDVRAVEQYAERCENLSAYCSILKK